MGKVMDYKSLFDDLGSEGFEMVKRDVLSRRPSLIDYDKNRVAGELMNIAASKSVTPNINMKLFGRLMYALFPKTSNMLWLMKYCYVIEMTIKGMTAPPGDKDYLDYYNFMMNVLISDLRNEINGTCDQKVCFDLLSRIYKISIGLYHSAALQKKMDLNMQEAVFIMMKRKLNLVLEKNRDKFEKNEIDYFGVMCLILEIIICNEDGIALSGKVNG